MSFIIKYIKMKTIMVTVLAAMLAVTSCLADTQADLVARLKANPTENFSQSPDQTDSDYFDTVMRLSNADALVYFQAHPLREKGKSMMDIGRAHAFKHQL